MDLREGADAEGKPQGLRSKWLSAKTSDWQEVWLRVGCLGACEWLRGPLSWPITSVELSGAYHKQLDRSVLLFAVSRSPNFVTKATIQRLPSGG